MLDNRGPFESEEEFLTRLGEKLWPYIYKAMLEYQRNTGGLSLWERRQ